MSELGGDDASLLGWSWVGAAFQQSWVSQYKIKTFKYPLRMTLICFSVLKITNLGAFLVQGHVHTADQQTMADLPAA